MFIWYNIIIDHKLLKDMIAETLNSEENFNVVATDGNARVSISLCKKFKPNLNFINDAKKNKVDSFIYKNISKDSLVMTIKNTLDGYSMYLSFSIFSYITIINFNFYI